MIEKKIREASKSIVNGLAIFFASRGISPNTMTIISFIIGIIGVYFIAIKALYIAVFFILLSGILDALDGSIARLTGKTSRFGAFLDSTLDKIVEITIFIGIYFYNQELAFPVILAISLMMLSSYTNKHIAAFNISKTDHRPFFYIYSLADRIQRIIIVAIVLLVPAYMMEILYFYIIILLISFIQRFVEGYKILK